MAQDIPALLAEWERAAQFAHGGNAVERPLLVTAQLIEAGDKLAKALSERAGAEPLVTIVRAVQTCYACPSQWDAWDSEGTYWYLRYRFGSGTMSRTKGGTADSVLSFATDDALDGSITLEEFCQQIGVTLDLQ